ncbi:sulfatase-like hydrolase/transferase [Taibaiella soli]|uniref:Sulfatase N-terminal domain-containing protein n=1 Tax=Taibaiella soli TaxID=1649169 RepID=A0A2W2ACN1_9BACT|nr:sulfatase-like hydrolase/transferase [Taibaiella soli]PZF73051.1 hypothetical protein DN068_09260 [Taibaiella soli]
MPAPQAILKQWKLFPFLLPLFFVIHGWQHYFGLVGVKDVLQLSVIYLAVAAVLYRVIRLFAKDRMSAAVLCFLILLLQLYWGDTLGLAKAQFPDGFFSKIPVVFAIWTIAIIAGYFLFKKLGDKTQQQFVFYLNLLFVIYLLVDISVITGKSFNHRKVVAGQESTSANTTAATHWNVYFILFDEYAGSKSLREDYGFDNAATDSFLRAHNFSIQEHSRSNYPQTFFSMASILNANYLTGVNPKAVRPADYKQAIKNIKESSVVKTFVQQDYLFNNCSYFDVGNMPALSQNEFLLSGTEIITANTLYDLFVKDYLQMLHLKSDEAVYRTNTYNNKMMDRVMEQAKEPKQKPVFVYCHLTMPHPPFYYGPNGNLYTPDSVEYGFFHNRTQHYLYNVAHANLKMKMLVDSILHYDHNAAILLLSDHGYRVPYDTVNLAAKFRNLNAVYFPDKNYQSLYDSISNVNVLRVIMNKVLGTNYQMLPDSTSELNDVK